jgi:hypothetical protein
MSTPSSRIKDSEKPWAEVLPRRRKAHTARKIPRHINKASLYILISVNM